MRKGGEMNEFRNQGALTIIAEIKPGEEDNLRGLLKKMVPSEDQLPRVHVEFNDIVPFDALTTIHFARFVVVDKSLSVTGELRSVKPFLILSTNYDNPLDKHLEQLVDEAGNGLDQIFSHCENYPESNDITRQAQLAYLRKHMKRYGAFHNGTVGLSVKRIRQEAALRNEIEKYIDEQGISRDWSSTDKQQNPGRIRQEIVSHINETEFKWALTPPGKPPLSYLLFRGSGLWTFIKLIISLLALPVLLTFAITLTVLPNLSLLFNIILCVIVSVAFFGIWLIILRYKEEGDKIMRRTRYDERDEKLAAREDKVVQNQMTLLVDMKPGLVRLLTLKFFFAVIEVAARYIFTKGKLSGIPTIHFARWVFALKNKGVMFFSNYGSSWESYLGDFIDKGHAGLTGIWSNTVLFPRTRWLIFDGATDEERFKVVARAQQMKTDVWYTAYKTLTVKNILNNKEIRKGLSGDLTREQTLEWLRRL